MEFENLKKGMSISWSGRRESIFFSDVVWDCYGKIVDIKDNKIYILSFDDRLVSEWSKDGIYKQNVKIKKVTGLFPLIGYYINYSLVLISEFLFGKKEEK